MKIPRKVRIGGVDYDVREVDHLNNGTIVCYGQISIENSTISLHSGNQGHHMKCITLWHEILHGIAAHAKLNLGEGQEEHVVEVLAKGIYQVLQDNEREMFDREVVKTQNRVEKHVKNARRTHGY